MERFVLMQWTYTGNSKLASMASHLYAQRSRTCALSPYIFMTDPVRVPDVVRSAAGLPKGSTLIYRHFGADNKYSVATVLRQICFVRDVQFLIGQDETLARDVGADGLHLPERDLARGQGLRRRYPDWLLSGAVHRQENLQECVGLDAAIVSPVFASQSPSADVPLGVEAFCKIVHATDVSVFALGGIHAQTVAALKGTGAAGIAGVSGFCGQNI